MTVISRTIATLAKKVIRPDRHRRSHRLMMLLSSVGIALSAPAMAHHSYAMFDKGSVTELQGKVAKFEWTNPHVFLWVYARPTGADSTGKYELYGFEGGSPGTLLRSGWSPTSFASGEQVGVRFYPLKDGRRGGSFFQVTHADGSISTSEGVGSSTP